MRGQFLPASQHVYRPHARGGLTVRGSQASRVADTRLSIDNRRVTDERLPAATNFDFPLQRTEVPACQPLRGLQSARSIVAQSSVALGPQLAVEICQVAPGRHRSPGEICHADAKSQKSRQPIEPSYSARWVVASRARPPAILRC